jgi:ribosomal protein S18 acetylase RimI-like enzyme
MITIRKIIAEVSYPVRHEVLRKGKPIDSCLFEGDDIATTQHYGLFEDDRLQGIISVFETSNPLFTETRQKQIRGMAVLEHNQGKGYGKQLVQYCEKILLDSDCELIWFNARENAKGFYQKLGYTIQGKPFNIEGIGIHYVMWKKLRV